ncbi:hypothetical protein [Treponema sp. Marseille-Q4523]|uniref:hypothetical protein n=1 Tax=Treponema sp. Marseille-Q4523 TaxID=2810610 RepID=UPI001960841E|nr:hypothetical protein [Treponema sp. Marseille-Q4523]MBM7023873.1 hypothetical protein [Treponema sp. Marseille-Q4523]
MMREKQGRAVVRRAGSGVRQVFMLLYLVLSSVLIFADTSLRSLFDFKEYPYKEIQIKDRGTLEPQYIKDSDYSTCWIFSIENIKGIETFLYYPMGNNKECRKGKFEINGQEFVYNESDFDLHSLKLCSANFEDKTFLMLLGNIGKYDDRICFIFDITDPEHIVFYPPGKRFIEADFDKKFFGLYQNKLCFFFSIRRFEWNGQYKLSPYVIDGDLLKELCDENGKPYFINYSYTTKYEQEFVIEGKNVPDGK